MRTKTVAGLVIVLLVLLIAWWWLDPVGFYRNPVLTWFKGLGVPLPDLTR